MITAIDTSGRAVLFAGLTVIIALLGMLAIGLSFISGLGHRRRGGGRGHGARRGHVAARGARLRRHEHRPAGGCRGCTTTATAPARPIWHRWSRFVQRHAWLLTIAGLARRDRARAAGAVAATRFRRRRQRPRGHADPRGLRPRRQGLRSRVQRPVPARDPAAAPAATTPPTSRSSHDGGRGDARRRVGLARDHQPGGHDRGHPRVPDDRTAGRGHEHAAAPPARRRDPRGDRRHRRARSTSAGSRRSPTTSPTCSANGSRCSSAS